MGGFPRLGERVPQNASSTSLRGDPATTVRALQEPRRRLLCCAAMLLHTPDPAYTSSERAHANFKLAVRIAIGFVALLWLIQLSNWVLGLGPADFGVRPRELAGIPGIFLAPLLHGGFEHLLSNTPPLLVLGTAMLYLYPNSIGIVLPAVYLGSGALVWAFGPERTSHVGASGLVYGLAAYIFVAGMIRRDRRAIGAALLVCFMYGALVWGVFPIQTGVSWQTHLAAALIGVALAFALRRRDIPPRRRYDWEDEPDDVADEQFEWQGERDELADQARPDIRDDVRR